MVMMMMMIITRMMRLMIMMMRLMMMMMMMMMINGRNDTTIVICPFRSEPNRSLPLPAPTPLLATLAEARRPFRIPFPRPTAVAT